MVMMVWIILAITIGLVVGLGIYSIYTNKKPETDYYSLYWMGIFWLPLGIIFNNSALFIIGLIFLGVGLANKNKWKKPKPWKKLTKRERKVKLILIGLTLILVIVGFVFFLMNHFRRV